jgi:hypothetical protein
VAVEAGIEGAVEGAAVVAPRARRRHPPVDTEDVVDGMARAAVLAAIGIGSRHRHLPRLLLLPPRRLSPSLLTGLKLGIIINHGADEDSVRLPASSATWST